MPIIDGARRVVGVPSRNGSSAVDAADRGRRRRRTAEVGDLPRERLAHAGRAGGRIELIGSFVDDGRLQLRAADLDAEVCHGH